MMEMWENNLVMLGCTSVRMENILVKKVSNLDLWVSNLGLLVNSLGM